MNSQQTLTDDSINYLNVLAEIIASRPMPAPPDLDAISKRLEVQRKIDKEIENQPCQK